MLAGFGIGVGNYLVARISSQGAVALAYVGLVAFFLLSIGRGSQFIMNKIKHGTFVDYNKSNFFTNEK